jgi:undecaprenyl pyrophosphate phosphatase UppP
METPSVNHTTSDIGKTVLSLGSILAVVFAFWQMQNSVREDIRPELQELRTDVKKIEEKVNLLIGQQDILVRRMALAK